MFYQLPPVGNPVCLDVHRDYETDLNAVTQLPSGQVRYYASGTAALAAAVMAAMKAKNIESAEVILPAYGCPDLVSAVECAGGRPVLVDFEAGLPWLDLMQLKTAVTGNTVAVVGVNLFGISERWTHLRELAELYDLILIEDSAQYFPANENRHDSQGDLVIFSFGRGKPVSLLGGGAVRANNTSLLESLPQPDAVVPALPQRIKYNVKAKLYNAMISPRLYWFPRSLPFLHLGETRYHTLPAIEAMDQVRMELLPGNIACYQDDAESSVRCEKISSMLGSLTCSQLSLKDLPRVCNMESNRRLLRYPLLLEAGTRDIAYQRLMQAGLGASIMYPASLPNISGMRHIVDQRQVFPNADDFAARVLTLPTHAGVSGKDIEKMKTIFCELE